MSHTTTPHAPSKGACLLALLLASAPASAAAAGGDAAAPFPAPTLAPVVLAERAAGLEVVSAPAELGLTVGHVAYLPVEVQGYRRPLAVTAQTLIHTFVADLTPSEPGASPPFAVPPLTTARGGLTLQTLRMRPHQLTLTFSAPGSTAAVTFTVSPTVTPRAPLFGIAAPPGLEAPFDGVWGPSCEGCPVYPGDPEGTTRDRMCAKRLHRSGLDGQCRCRLVGEARNASIEARVRREAPQMQRYASQLLRSLDGWVSVQTAPDRYLWDRLDWVFGELAPAERDYSPLYSDIIHGDGGWISCPEYRNRDGSSGFYGQDNPVLWEQYRSFIRELAGRYAGELRFFETNNEPCYGFYLCPCLDDAAGPRAACTATSGRNQPACADRHWHREFAATYGPFLTASAVAASEELAAANPDALLVAGALEISGQPLTVTTRYMIERGLLDRGNVAVMIHQFPYPSPPDWMASEPCVYSGFYYLPDGCETPPPLDDYVTPAGRPVLAREKWQAMDQVMDATPLLRDAERLGVRDHFYLFDTELHAGFFVKDRTTTTGRTTMAGLRVGAINAHQRYAGLNFIGAAADPAPYNVMVKHLAGATPVYAWDAPLLDADYSGLVYKLYTRGAEDIIAVWSNASGPRRLRLERSALAAHIARATLTRLVALPHDRVACEDARCAEQREPVEISVASGTAVPAIIAVEELREVVFLSVLSDRPGFAWLADLAVEPVPRIRRRIPQE